MAKKDILIDYDYDEDLLSLSSKNEKVKFSFDINLPIGDFIVNYGFDGRIVGIEFSNASVFFPKIKEMDLDKAKASISIQYGKNWAQISYLICVPNESNQIIQGIIPTPYNKEMILEN
jgi:hypothetical protein